MYKVINKCYRFKWLSEWWHLSSAAVWIRGSTNWIEEVILPFFFFPNLYFFIYLLCIKPNHSADYKLTLISLGRFQGFSSIVKNEVSKLLAISFNLAAATSTWLSWSNEKWKGLNAIIIKQCWDLAILLLFNSRLNIHLYTSEVVWFVTGCEA